MSQTLEPVNGSLENLVHFFKQPALDVLVVSHNNPDGDAIGSELAMGLVLEKMGHRVHFYNQDPVPDVYGFLQGSDRIRNGLPKGKNFAATFITDVHEMDRAGLKDFSLEVLGKICILDHHRTDKQHGFLQFIDSNAAASGVLVYRFAKLAGVVLDLAIAENIYCCIMTDTGSFHYSSATPEAFAISGEMVALGVEPWEFAKRVYESQPAARLKLLAAVLPTLDISPDGLFAAIHVEESTLKEHQASADLTDGFINYPRSIEGVEVAIFIRGNSDGTYKASFRSGGRVDVRAICEELGGGGHRNAAGCKMQGTLVSVRERVYNATRKHCQMITK